LHHQICEEEGWGKFRVRVTPIDSQETFLKLAKLRSGPPYGYELPPGFYVTSYTQLSINGVDSLADPENVEPWGLLHQWKLPADRISEETLHTKAVSPADLFRLRASRWNAAYHALGVGPNTTLSALETAYQQARERAEGIRDDDTRQNVLNGLAVAHRVLQNLCPASAAAEHSFTNLNHNQKTYVVSAFVTDMHGRWTEAVGTSRDRVKGLLSWPLRCVYSPALSDLCADSFACVVIDEAVRMKGEDTAVGLAVRSMRPAFRLILTATAIKNRLPDIFRLAWWAAGGFAEAHARFPYSDSSSEREDFAKSFLVSESNLTKAAVAKEKGKKSVSSRYKKLTPQVCNIHRLWKLFGPLILRRLKKDCGEEIVAKHHKVIRVQMGKSQRDAYAYHLGAEYLDKNDQKALGAQLQALRLAAVAPASESLQYKGIVVDKADPDKRRLPYRASADYIPKIAATLELIHGVVERKEQVMVFSAFKEPLAILSQRLNAAGVRHVILSGDVNQAQRARVMSVFKKGRFQPGADGAQAIPVILASVESMAEGHSCPLVSNAILISYSWAMDKFRQAIDRIYRLNSVKDVTVWSVLCDQTIDAKLESNIRDKADASDLVLDGKLLGETPKEENFFELLEYARLNFDAKANTVDDAALQAGWPALRMRLARAQREWDKFESLPAATKEEVMTVKPVAVPVSHYTMLAKTVEAAPTAPVPLFAKPVRKDSAPPATSQPARPVVVARPVPSCRTTPTPPTPDEVLEIDSWARRLAWRREMALATA
jgi:hypothetical protein